MTSFLHKSLILCFFWFATAKAQTITIWGVSPDNYGCTAAGANMYVTYIANGFAANTDFSIELSANNNTFPGTVLATNNHGTFSAQYLVAIPINTVPGNYSVRVSSTSPAVSSVFDLGAVTAEKVTLIPRSRNWCVGSTQVIDQYICGMYNPGNDLSIQMSDAAGTFASPVTIGSATNITSGYCFTPCSVPSLAPGNSYRIRVVSTSPAMMDTLSDLITIAAADLCACDNGKLEMDWQASFAGNNYDQLIVNIQTADGGYLLGGYSISGVSGNKTEGNYGNRDYWVVKIDANGNKLWEEIYGGTLDDFMETITPTDDGGYLLGGFSRSAVNGNKTIAGYGSYDYWIVKIDASGNKLWDQSYGGSGHDVLYAVTATADGGYLLAGESTSGISGNKTTSNFGNYDYWVVKIDAGGNKLWDQSYGGSGVDGIFSITPVSDGNYFLGGWSESGATGNKTTSNYGGEDYWLVKIDDSGNKLSEHVFGGTGNDELKIIIPTLDGGYLLGGKSESGVTGNKTAAGFGGFDYWILKVDVNGTKIWEQGYGGLYNERFFSMATMTDGNYLLGGGSFSSPAGGNKSSGYIGSEDFWVVKIDPNGNKIYDQIFGGIGQDALLSISVTDDGGYLLGGLSVSPVGGTKTTIGYGNGDYWIMKIKPVIDLNASPRTTVICTGDSIVIDYDLNCGLFKANNTIKVQLSDINGSFASPLNLLTKNSIITSGVLTATIPAGLAEGSTYKLRITSSLPSVISDTTINIQILTHPNISTLTESCAFGKEFSGIIPSSSSKQWQLNGVDIGGATSLSIFPTQFGDYRIRTFNAGCKDTSFVYSVIPANTPSSNTCTIADGLTRFICDNTTGEVIAKIIDGNGGNVLGATDSKMYLDATVQLYNTQPYVQRHYDITPASSGAANITLYVPQSEYDAFNIAASTNWPHLPTGPADIMNMNNLVITQYHGASATHLPGTYSGLTEYLQFPNVLNTWNAALNMWEVNFSVTNFSGIFLHTLQNFSLPVELINFNGTYSEERSIIQLNWQTASELNCKHFEIERMNSAGQFEFIGTVSCQGNSNVLISYVFYDKDFTAGDNYYRLKQVDEDGTSKYSAVINVKVTGSHMFYFNSILQDDRSILIRTSEAGKVELIDISGKIIQTFNSEEKTIPTEFLAKGIYFIRFRNEQHTKTNKIFVD